MDCQESCIEELKHYAEINYTDELMQILLEEDTRKHYSVTIDTMSLFESNVTFAHLLFEFPERALKLLDQAFYQAALQICNSNKRIPDLALRGTIHVRLTALPHLPEIYRTSLPLSSDVGQFMCISGTVIRKTACKIVEFKKLWKCKKCRYQFIVDAEVEKGYIFEKPTVCPNPEWCNGKNFALLSTDVDPMYCKDYCEVKIQQQFNTLTVGSVPRSMWIILEDDLVDTCHPGNDVNVSGVLIQRWKPLSRGNFIDIDLILFAHNVEVKNKMIPGELSESLAQELGKFWLDNQSNPLKGRDFILSCICPQVFGLYIVKLAVALILAGGVERKDENSRIRGDSHLLLVGDPGTGKSQFLKFASKVCMRSVLTSGIGTTNAGLTVSAVKETGKWQLEAGALVLADGGLCCIDEFSCIKEQDKTCIHEAMEQQTISVAKAGLVCSLSTKCSILAATNPKGKYDANLSLSENTALASPLLSRFDVILVLLDTYDENWDKMVSSYILDGHNYLVKSNQKSWSISKMRSYFNMIRHINPKMTVSCEKVLQTYYRRQRSQEGRNFARTTPRLLQSLIRLAEGHARLMFRDEVLVIDAIMAIILMESSMSGSAVLDGLTTLHTSFPEDPKTEYNEKAKSVLELLNLQDLLPDSENYGFSYQDLCIKKLLSEVAVTCKSNKSKSYLFASSYFSDDTHYLEDRTNNHNSFPTASYREPYIPNTTNGNISSNSLNDSDILKSTEVLEDLNKIISSDQNKNLGRVATINKNHVSATALDNMDMEHNGNSTITDDTEMSFHDIFQQPDITENSLTNLFKREYTNDIINKNKASATALDNMDMEHNGNSTLTDDTEMSFPDIFQQPDRTENSLTNLFKRDTKEVNSKTKQINNHPASESISDSVNEIETSVSSSPPAKRVALTRPQNMDLLKKFTFQKSLKKGIYQVTRSHQISESPFFNRELSDDAYISENNETNLVCTENNKELLAETKINVGISKSLYFNCGLPNDAYMSENKEINLLRTENNEKPVEKTNRTVENNATGNHSDAIKTNVLDSETMLNLIAPNPASAVDQNYKASNAETVFSPNKNLETILSNNESSSAVSFGGKNKIENRLQKFLFKGKSKKSGSTDLSQTDCSNPASVSNIAENKHTSENIKNASNILSSQRAFKRIFTTTDRDQELDDSFFEI